MNTPIRFTSPVEIQAATGKPKRFTTTAYTGTALQVSGYSLPIVVDLAGLSTRKSVTANLDHDSSKRVGHVDDVQNSGSQLVLGGVVSAANIAAQEFIEAAANGYPWQASIEASPSSIEDVPKGSTIQANGRTFKGPLYVARKSVLSAVAFVPNGADDDTTVSIAAKRKKLMTDFQTWAAECGINTELMTAGQMASLRANHFGRSQPTDEDHEAVLPLIAASSDPVQAERHRINQIEAACVGTWGEHAERVTELKAQAIGGELGIDDLLSQLRAIRQEQTMNQFSTSTPAIHSSSRDTQPQVIEASFALAGGLSHPEKHYSEQVLDAADKLRGSVSMQQLVMAEACKNGYVARPGEGITQGNLRPVLQAAFAPIRASGYSTISLPNTFSNVANKFLRDGFNSVDQTCLRIAAIRSVKDFKEITTISLTGGMVFQPVAPDGEIKHGQVGEEVYNNQASTYGIMFQVSRHDLINDDTSALTAVPRRIGRGGMLKLNDLFWALFLNNSAFFTSGRNNLIIADLNLGGLEEAETKFINQVDQDGHPLGIMPQILLVPPAKKATALTLMNSQTVITGTDETLPSVNVWQSRFKVESSPYMQNAAYSGSSDEAWYLLASPAQLPVIEICALNGRVEPVVETADVDFSQLGIAMRGYSDVGVALQEYRGGVMSDGSET